MTMRRSRSSSSPEPPGHPSSPITSDGIAFAITTVDETPVARIADDHLVAHEAVAEVKSDRYSGVIVRAFI